MSDRLIALYKLPGVRPMSVREKWHQRFSKCVLKVTGPEATHTYKDKQIYAGVKAGINGSVHRVQYV